MKTEDVSIYFISDNSFGEMASGIPPLGVGMISGYLTKGGYNHRVTNLFRNSWLSTDAMKRHSVWLDETRAQNYAAGQSDEEYETAVKSILGDAPLRDGAVFAFSLETKPFNLLYPLLALARYLKEHCSCSTIVGGEAQQEWMFEFLKSDYIDFAVSSHILFSLSGHRPFLEFIREFEKDQPDYSSVAGLLYKDGGEIKFNPPIDSDIFFPPDFTLFDIDRYRLKIPEGFAEPGNDSVLTLPYRFSAGCRHSCAYCVLSNSRVQQHLSVDEIVGQLKEIVETTGCRNFIFLNPCVNITKKFTLDLAHALETSGLDIQWSDCARFEGMDKETIEALARAGCVRLYFGFDTMTRNLKKYISKKLDLPHIVEVMKLCRDNNIWVGLDIIPGFPYESGEEIEALCDFIRENSYLIDTVCIIPFMLLRHTDFYTNAQKHRIRLLDRGVLETPIVPFDEIEGRSWNEIEAHTTWAADRVFKTVVDELGYCNDSECLPLVFWARGKYKTKNEIKKIYKKLLESFHRESHARKSGDAKEPVQALGKSFIVKVKSAPEKGCPLNHFAGKAFIISDMRLPDELCKCEFIGMRAALNKLINGTLEKHCASCSVEVRCPETKVNVVFEARELGRTERYIKSDSKSRNDPSLEARPSLKEFIRREPPGLKK